MIAVAPTTLGPFAVTATPDEVSAFRMATGLAAAGDVLPLTFPMRWLASPEVEAALLALIAAPDTVPVHEGQTFVYATPLRADVPYALTLLARRETEPDRLVADGTIVDASGTIHASLELVLRLFSTAAVAA